MASTFTSTKGGYYCNWPYGRDIDIYCEDRVEERFPDDYGLRIEDFRISGWKKRVEEEKEIIEEAKNQDIQKQHPHFFVLGRLSYVIELGLWPKHSVGFIPRPKAAGHERAGAKRDNDAGKSGKGDEPQGPPSQDLQSRRQVPERLSVGKNGFSVGRKWHLFRGDGEYTKSAFPDIEEVVLAVLR